MACLADSPSMLTPTILTELPEGFLDLKVENILTLFPKPSLIHIKGDKPVPLFVSILLHGNEYSGLKAVQALLRNYPARLPRSIYLFIGNVTAAAEGLRVIPGQTDYNRCWPGTEMCANDETGMMQAVIEHVTRDALFAAVDVHNNSGFNPHYACISDVTRDNLQLAAMFNHIGLVIRQTKGLCTMAFDGICPATTLECGRPGEAAGIAHTVELLDGLLHIDHLPQRPLPAHDLQLMESFARVKIPQHIDFEFDLNGKTELQFDPDFERYNFSEIHSHHVFARSRTSRPLMITNRYGSDITDQIIRVEHGKVFLNKTLMPAMITTDEAIVRQDCLCYLLTDYQPDIGNPGNQ